MQMSIWLPLKSKEVHNHILHQNSLPEQETLLRYFWGKKHVDCSQKVYRFKIFLTDLSVALPFFILYTKIKLNRC